MNVEVLLVDAKETVVEEQLALWLGARSDEYFDGVRKAIVHVDGVQVVGHSADSTESLRLLMAQSVLLAGQNP